MNAILLSPEMGSELLEDEYIAQAKPVVSLETLLTECDGDEDLTDFLDSMLDFSARYTITVIESKRRLVSGDILSPEDRAEKDAKRKQTHDSTIDSINAFARLLTKKGKNGRWIRELNGNRAAYGKLAMLLTFSRLLKGGQ